MQAADPTRTSSSTMVDDIAFTLCLSVFAVSFAVSLAVSSGSVSAEGPVSARPATTWQGQPKRVGAFTGRYGDGAPVYRLPPISVSASRKVEMARIEEEDRQARAPAAAGRDGRRPEPMIVSARSASD